MYNTKHQGGPRDTNKINNHRVDKFSKYKIFGEKMKTNIHVNLLVIASLAGTFNCVANGKYDTIRRGIVGAIKKINDESFNLDIKKVTKLHREFHPLLKQVGNALNNIDDETWYERNLYQHFVITHDPSNSDNPVFHPLKPIIPFTGPKTIMLYPIDIRSSIPTLVFDINNGYYKSDCDKVCRAFHVASIHCESLSNHSAEELESAIDYLEEKLAVIASAELGSNVGFRGPNTVETSSLDKNFLKSILPDGKIEPCDAAIEFGSLLKEVAEALANTEDVWGNNLEQHFAPTYDPDNKRGILNPWRPIKNLIGGLTAASMRNSSVEMSPDYVSQLLKMAIREAKYIEKDSDSLRQTIKYLQNKLVIIERAKHGEDVSFRGPRTYATSASKTKISEDLLD